MALASSPLEQATKLHREGRSEDALLLLDKARRVNPRDTTLYAGMADLFETLGQTQAAEQVLQAALLIAPADVMLVNQLANYFYRANKPDAGLALTRPFLAERALPALLITHANLCKLAGQMDEAQKIYEDVLQNDAGNVFALSNLGGFYLDARDYPTAMDYFSRALKAEPANAHVNVQMAHAAFRAGQLDKGWDHYVHRFGAGVLPRPFPQKSWRGEKIKHGKLLLWGEQGIGEQILHASLLGRTPLDPAHVIVECDGRLVPLFTRSFPGFEFVAKADPPDHRLMVHDVSHQAPLGTLGQLYRRIPESFPEGTAYLKAEKAKTKLIRARYESLLKRKNLSGKIIGISWMSKPLRHGDPKSTELAHWQSLLENSPHLFIDLQFGATATDVSNAQAKGWALHHDAAIDQAVSLDDFASQVAALDGVITVSNTTAHMAGALGIPTGVLLPRAHGLMWHWFDNRMDSPWYASVALLRQREDGNWQDSFREAANLIANLK